MYGDAAAPPERIEHGPLVAAIAAFLRPRSYVELGVDQGVTFAQVRPHVGEAWAIDINADACVLVQSLAGHFHLGTSKQFLENCPDSSIDLAFVDSSHRFEDTVEECALLHAKVRLNGVILLHDSYPSNDEQMQAGFCGQVYRAIHVIKTNLGWEGMTLPAQYGLTLFRKHGGHQLAWR